MTPQEAAVSMEEIAHQFERDPEAMHTRANHLLCVLLQDIGYRECIATFDKMKKHYA